MCIRLAQMTILFSLEFMKSKSLCWLFLLIAVLASSGVACSTESGAREFIPGKGWKPVD
jgi:hypothetical protein